MNKTVCALLWPPGTSGRCALWPVWWTASVRKRKVAPPDGLDRAGPKGEQW